MTFSLHLLEPNIACSFRFQNPISSKLVFLNSENEMSEHAITRVWLTHYQTQNLYTIIINALFAYTRKVAERFETI